MAFNSLLNWSTGDSKSKDEPKEIEGDRPKGIKKDLFIGDEYEVFLCPACNQVAVEPVVASCCESAFCKLCFDSTMKCDTDSCKGCNQQFSYGITSNPFQKQLNMLYQRLKLKCQDCSQLMTMKEYCDEHDDCPGKKFNCISCGFNYNLPKGERHDCIEWLKTEKEKFEQDLKYYKQVSEWRIKELEEENEQLKETFREFLEKNGFIGCDQDGNFQLQEPKSSRNNNARQPKSKASEEKNLPQVPEVYFNLKETLAPEEIQNYVATAVKDMARTGKKLFSMMPHFREFMRISIAGQWCLFERSAINSVVNSFNIDPRTFCSFTFDGLKYIAFKRVRGGNAEMVKTNPELVALMAKIRSFGRSGSIEVGRDAIDYKFSSGSSGSSAANSRNSPVPSSSETHNIIFNEEETFAPKKVRNEVAAAINQIAKGKKIDTNFKDVRAYLCQRLTGNWFIHERSHLSCLIHTMRKVVLDSFCSFSIDEEKYVVFRRASGAESRRREVEMREEHQHLVTALLKSAK